MLLDYAAIAARHDIAQVAAALGIQLVRRIGREYVFAVPWRADATPSGRINPQKNRWFDMSRGEGGDAIDLAARKLGVGRREAALWIEQRAGELPAVQTNFHYRQQAPTSTVDPIAWRAAAVQVLAAAQRNLAGEVGAPVRAYLRSARGTSSERAQQLGIGYLPSPIRTPYGPVAAGIVLPHYDSAGELVKVQVRTITGALAAALDRQPAADSAKYKQMTGSKNGAGWFGAPVDAVAGRAVILVEGELDAACLGGALVDALAITLGGAGERPRQWAIDALGTAASVWICLDADGAGTAAASALQTALIDAGIAAHVIGAPAGYKDVCDAFAAGVDLRAWWAAAQRSAAAADRVHAAGVPNTWRALFSVIDQRAAGWGYELLAAGVRSGALDALAFTRADIMAWVSSSGWQISTGTVYRLVQLLVDLGVVEVDSVLVPLVKDKGDSNGINLPDRGGRPEKGYRLRPLIDQKTALLARLGRVCGQRAAAPRPRLLANGTESESPGFIAPLRADDLIDYLPADAADDLPAVNALVDPAELDQPRQRIAAILRRWSVELDDPTSAPISSTSALVSASGWQAAYTRAIELANERVLTRRDRARQLGVSPRRVGELMQRAGFRPVGQGERVELEVNAGDLAPVWRECRARRARAVGMYVNGQVAPFDPAALQLLPANTPVLVKLQPPTEYADAGEDRLIARKRSRPRQRLPEVDLQGGAPIEPPAAQLPRVNTRGTYLHYMRVQLRLRLERLGWQHQYERGRLLDRRTGELVRDTDLRAMWAAITGGRQADPDEVLEAALALGGRVRQLAPA